MEVIEVVAELYQVQREKSSSELAALALFERWTRIQAKWTHRASCRQRSSKAELEQAKYSNRKLFHAELLVNWSIQS